MKKILLFLILTSFVISLSAFSTDVPSKSNLSSPPSIVSEDVPIYDIGEYDLGNGVTLTVNHIPKEELDDNESTAASNLSNYSDTMPIIDPAEIQVYDVGEYDLGNGIILTVEHIPSGELNDNANPSARLHQSNSELPLTSSWSWFCSDDPWLPTNLKFYNNSSKNPGNLYGYVWVNDGAMGAEYYTLGIAPGDMARISIGAPINYSVYLSASVTGYYKVIVTDWP